MAVRSRRLFSPLRPASAATFTDLYLVPAGRTARASLFTIANLSNVDRLCIIALVVTGGVRALWEGHIAAETTVQVLQGWVGNPGDQLQAYCSGASACDFSGFGSLLLGEPE